MSLSNEKEYRRQYRISFNKKNPGREKEWRRKNYLKNIEARRAYAIAYGKAHPEKVNVAWKRPRKRFARYKHAARKRGLDFSLTFEKFNELIHQDCHYCGRGNPTKGVDRKDNLKGYTLQNAVPCCWDCNNAKGKHSKPEFILMSTLIADRFKAGVI